MAPRLSDAEAAAEALRARLEFTQMAFRGHQRTRAYTEEEWGAMAHRVVVTGRFARLDGVGKEGDHDGTAR